MVLRDTALQIEFEIAKRPRISRLPLMKKLSMIHVVAARAEFKEFRRQSRRPDGGEGQDAQRAHVQIEQRSSG